MNKPKHQMTNRARKKMNKEVRASSIQPTLLPRSNTIQAPTLLSKYPKKIQKKEAASLKSFTKNLGVQVKKKSSPHSKRTAPGARGIDQKQAAPRVVHIEGQRWMKSTESKIQANKKVMNRQRLKKKGP